MAYSAQITRENPTALLFLIDQSASMDDAFAGSPGSDKKTILADTINRLLYELSVQCTKGEDGVRDYFHVGVIGYGAGVGPAFLGQTLQGQELVPLSTLAENPFRIEEREKKEADGSGGLVSVPFRLPIWFEPVASNGTPMAEALQVAARILSGWVSSHPEGFPPIVINITDGEPNTDPTGDARHLRSLSTKDGEVLLFNVHVSGRSSGTVMLPDSGAGLPDRYAEILFEMSSELPQSMQVSAKAEGFAVTAGSRGFVFNADGVELIRFLNIGTQFLMTKVMALR